MVPTARREAGISLILGGTCKRGLLTDITEDAP